MGHPADPAAAIDHVPSQDVLVRRFHRVYVNHGDRTVRVEPTVTAVEMAYVPDDELHHECKRAERIAASWADCGYRLAA